MTKQLAYVFAFLIALGMTAHGQTPSTARGWIGVQVQQVTADLGEALGLKPPRGALVAEVDEGGPAGAAGIRPGDVIVKFDGEDIPDYQTLPSVVGATPIGKAVNVVIIRVGKEENRNLTVAPMAATAPALGSQATCVAPLNAFAKPGTQRFIEQVGNQAIQQARQSGVLPFFVSRNTTSSQAAIILVFLTRLPDVLRIAAPSSSPAEGTRQIQEEMALAGFADKFIAALRSPSPEIVQSISEQVFACFPYLMQPFQSAAAEMDRAKQARQEAQEREQREAERREHEQQEQREEEAAKAREPQNVLKAQYANYIAVKRCYAARQGYLAVYISEPEMARAKQAITSIEELLKPSLPPGITTDALWSQAGAWPVVGAMTPDRLGQFLQMPAPVDQIRGLCQRALATLLQTNANLAPRDNAVRKDFP